MMTRGERLENAPLKESLLVAIEALRTHFHVVPKTGHPLRIHLLQDTTQENSKNELFIHNRLLEAVKSTANGSQSD